jgi:hypothetical protein
MAKKKPAKRRVPAGRVTPKGTRPGASASEASTRYTPPVARETKVSPIWVPILMFTLLGLGALVIFLNYLALVPGGETSNWYLLAGLGLILGGIVTATQYH